MSELTPDHLKYENPLVQKSESIIWLYIPVYLVAFRRFFSFSMH